MFIYFARILVKVLLSLRYRIHVRGLKECLKKGNKGILFMPNHPALIDPVIVSSVLARHFQLVSGEKADPEHNPEIFPQITADSVFA